MTDISERGRTRTFPDTPSHTISVPGEAELSNTATGTAPRIGAEATSFAPGDGTTGEYRPEPLEDAVPRMRGTGLAGMPGAPLMSRHDHIAAVREGQLASLHSWELVTAVDGPGTRLTFFLAGCPLRCLYCHNPDTLRMRDGHPILLSDAINQVLRYQAVFKATDGGLTISGGEPLMQPAFIRNLLRAVHRRGIHTAIDTAGFLGSALADDDLEFVDLVLLDIKSGDPLTYQRVTGRALEPTIQFGDRLHAAGVKKWIRFVLVPGLTDHPANIASAADIVAKWKSTVERVEVLPFHKMGEDKWKELNMPYQLSETPTPDKDEVEAARNIFRARGLTVY
ncbi:MAG: pyruvate formate-lyase-activating protein [Actinomycetaceae bacterium]|nr:pyruvate formate-lyase-activating protein [Actinomycetaceae bacterium]